MDVRFRPHEHRAGLERPLHLAELVLYLREAVVLLDHLAVRHVQLRRGYLVVAHESRELLEFPVVDHRDELRAVKHLPGLLVDDVAPDETPQAFRLRRRYPEPVRIGLELLDESEERLVLAPLPLVERPAPVDNHLLPDLALGFLFAAFLVLDYDLHLARHRSRLVPEVGAGACVPLGVERPRHLVPCTFPEALRHDVAVPRVDDVQHVGARIHPPVRDEDVPSHAQHVDRFLHRRPQRVVVERVAGEHPEGDRNAVVVHEQSELDDRLLPVLLADPEFPKPLRHDVPLVVQHVGVRPRRLEEEVRDVVEHGLRVPSRSAPDARVHAPDDLRGVLADDAQRVVDAAVVGVADYRAVPQLVLPDGRQLRGRVEKPSVGEEPDDADEVVPDLRRELDAREQLVQPERREHGIENHRRHPLRVAEVLLVAVFEGQRHGLPRSRPDERLEFLDERLAVPERLPQAGEVAGLAVVVPGERPD